MSIKLDWEVESEGGWEEVGEDPKTVEARRRRARRIRNGLVIILGILLAVGGIVAYRLITVGWQIRAALEETVAAETLSLRLGDRNTFLSAQSGVGGWQQSQEQTFEQYQSEGEQVEVTGQIVQMDISADRARVILKEVYNDTEYHVMWFYRRDASGWRHIAPGSGYWGEHKESHLAHFDFEYYSEDQPLVDNLSIQLNSWWGIACDLTACVGKPDPIRVKIEPDRLLIVNWADYDPNTLLIPSPLLGRFRPDGTIDPELRKQIANQIARRWADGMIGEEASGYSDVQWLEDEAFLLLSQSFEPDRMPAPLLTPLAQTYSKEIIPQLVMRIKRGEEATVVLADLTHTALPDLPVGWELYLTHRLRAEAAMTADGHPTEAILIYHDPARPGGTLGQCAEGVPVNSIQVANLRHYGDLLWAETHCTPEQGQATVSFIPFRLLSDRWALTRAAETDLGPVKEERGEHVTLRYFDIDTPQVEGLLADLERIYSQAVADFGIAEGGPGAVLAVVTVDPSLEYSLMTEAWRAQDPPDAIELHLTSSEYSEEGYNYYFNGGGVYPTSKEGIRSVALTNLIGELLLRTVGPEQADNPLVMVLLAWENNRIASPQIESGNPNETIWPDTQSQSTESPITSWADASWQPPESLESLWLDNLSGYSIPNHIAATVLLDLLVERYGEGVVARLVPNISQAGSMDDLLYRSLGIHNATIEAEWRERVQQKLDAIVVVGAQP